MKRRLLGAAFLAVLLLASCASEEEDVRKDDSPGRTDQDKAAAPEEQQPPPAEPAKTADPAPAPDPVPAPREEDPLGAELTDEANGFSFRPLAGMKSFSDAATEGIDKTTEDFMNASGMKRSPNTVFLYYSAKPFISLIADFGTDESLESGISEDKFREIRTNYEKSLQRFGMALAGMNRGKAGAVEMLLVEYRRIRQPYLMALSAVFHGLGNGRIVTITYAVDSYAWEEPLKKKLMMSMESFKTLKKKEGR